MRFIVAGALGFFGLGLGWLRRTLLLRLSGFVRVMTSAVGHEIGSFERVPMLASK